MTEKKIQTEIMLCAADHDSRLFRNTTGTAYQGKATRIIEDRKILLRKGDVVIHNARTIKHGLCKGSSDLIGWRTVTVRSNMVGRDIAVFVGAEVKNRHNDYATEEQLNFLRAVRDAGGIATVVRSVTDYVKAINNFLSKR